MGDPFPILFICRVFEKVGFVAYPASTSEIRIR